MTPAQRKVILLTIDRMQSYLDGYKQAAKEVKDVHDFDAAIAKIESELAELREGL